MEIECSGVGLIKKSVHASQLDLPLLALHAICISPDIETRGHEDGLIYLLTVQSDKVKKLVTKLAK